MAGLTTDGGDGVQIWRRRDAGPPTCAEVSPEVLARARLTVERVAAEPALQIELGCGHAAGWLLHATFVPRRTFRQGSVDPACDPEIQGPACERQVSAVPAKGPARLLPRTGQLVAPLDLDGDGVLEAMASGEAGLAVWYADGTLIRGPKIGGAWMQVGKEMVLVQGGAPRGFVTAKARAFSVSRAGFVERPELVKEAWRTTQAARCPKDPLPSAPAPADATAAAAPGLARPCPDIPADEQRAARAEILALVTSELAERGEVLAEGVPELSWGCAQPRLPALVTYCAGDREGACEEETGTWHFELWARGAHGMARISEESSGSVHMEWAVISQVHLVAHADVDGDGAADPIVEHTSHEGGSIETVIGYQAVVAGRVLPLLSQAIDSSVTRHVLTVPGPRGPRGPRDLVAIALRSADPTAVEGEPPRDAGLTVWELGPRGFVRHRGAGVARAAALVARLPATP